jgi:hypothetical protein
VKPRGPVYWLTPGPAAVTVVLRQSDLPSNSALEAEQSVFEAAWSLSCPACTWLWLKGWTSTSHSDHRR